MTAALAAHPEWGGDWHEPPDLERAEIDPRTGLLAAPDATEKRTEIFVSGTAPTAESLGPDESATPEEVPLPDADLPLPDVTPVYVPPFNVNPSPTPGRRASPPARGEDEEEDSSRLAGTVTLDIDPETGLLAAQTCPVIRTKTFALGTEPRRRCGPQYHPNPTALPRETRPRRTSPP